MANEELLDAGLIKEQIEAGEAIEFTKPVYAQAWFIAIFWLMAVIGYNAYTILLNGMYYPLVLLLAVILVLYIGYKFFTTTRRIVLVGDAVKVFGFSNEPKKEFRLSQLSAVIDSEEIYLIKKKQFTGGITFRKAYWGSQWDAMKAQFRSRSAYANSGDTAYAGLGGTPALGSNSSGASPISTIALIYDIALFPYFAIARSIAGSK